MFIIAVTFTVHEAHRDDFRRAILANAATSLREEDGCIVFDVCEAQDRPVFFLYEQYADEEAFGLHLAAPHVIDFDRESASWVSKKTVERFMLLPQTSRARDIPGHGR
ncbi:antibiotic biosynthesis monooxygenase [Caballeronia hypogeia]|uniref:Antibiotic biosynthesis monooxygenase n=1 Tax=Caballeronia hypogeia TaxID=1777140 RepID=A0A158A862_9BURK|nr:putative quinol monooxygenase [Caballeronia hypogeia]SAK54011.1 antibiotic biosynthesis monooxygenase [Caballeronia hypogeia]